MRWILGGLLVLSLVAAPPSEAKKKKKHRDETPICQPVCRTVRICQPVAIRRCCQPTYVSQGEAVKGSREVQQASPAAPEASPAAPVQQK
jgi:hypothetical protein